jgi:glycosyltransferase involved in cell wall biosynthesis
MIEKTKILFIITKSDLGGAQSYVKSLIENLYQKYEITLATGEEGSLTETIKAMGVKVYLIPSLIRAINPLTDFFAIKQTVDLIRQLQPDILHLHSSKAGIIGRIAGVICQVPTVFTAHGWGFTPRTPLIRRIVAYISEKLGGVLAAKIICVCESDRQLALSYQIGRPKTLVTIRSGIDNNTVTLANPALQPPRLIMVARFNEQKDQATLLKAIVLVAQSDIHLDLVGSGILLESCQKMAHDLGIADRVSFLGDRNDVDLLLARSQIFILATHYEGLPICILEAMRAGLPVIATNVNGIAEQVIDGKTGFLVPHADVTALKDALAVAIASPELRETLGKAGREKFLQEFTSDRAIAQTESVYHSVRRQEDTEKF